MLMQETNQGECPVCGTPLAEGKAPETRRCVFCGKVEASGLTCPEGHHVCDTCRSSDARRVIEAFVLTTQLKNPFELAELLMGHPKLPMLGCEHAFIATGALMAGLGNSPYGREKITEHDIRKAFDRTSMQAVEGYCASTGVCGIVPAIGACFSIFLGARCGSDREQKITMEAVGKAAGAIAELTGPSCCKAYVRTALFSANAFLSERFGIVLPGAEKAIVCRYGELHPHGCREEKCPYYRRKTTKDIFADSINLRSTTCHS